MDRNKKILLAIVAFIILAILGLLLLIGSTDITMEGTGAYVTVPNDYELNTDSGIASKGDVNIFFTGLLDGTQSTTDFYKAINMLHYLLTKIYPISHKFEIFFKFVKKLLLQNVFLQFPVDFLFFRRAPHDADIKILRASSDAKLPCLTLHSLSDADRLLQPV